MFVLNMTLYHKKKVILIWENLSVLCFPYMASVHLDKLEISLSTKQTYKTHNKITITIITDITIH